MGSSALYRVYIRLGRDIWGFTGVIGLSRVSSEFKHITPTMENHVEKKLDNDMATDITQWIINAAQLKLRSFLSLRFRV